MSFWVTTLDHVQVAMPGGREAEADAFCADVLGLEVLPKPEPLASRGGRWFACGEVQVHLGVEATSVPPAKPIPPWSSPAWMGSSPS